MHGQQLIRMPNLITINDNKSGASVTAAAAASSTVAARLLFLTARGISLQQYGSCMTKMFIPQVHLDSSSWRLAAGEISILVNSNPYCCYCDIAVWLKSAIVHFTPCVRGCRCEVVRWQVTSTRVARLTCAPVTKHWVHNTAAAHL